MDSGSMFSTLQYCIIIVTDCFHPFFLKHVIFLWLSDNDFVKNSLGKQTWQNVKG